MVENSQYPPDYDDYDDDTEDPERVNWVRIIGSVVAIIIMTGFAGGVWYAYDQGVKKGVQLAPPIIKADSAPIKVSPKDPGGMAIPHQDKKIFNVLKPEEVEPRVEKLMAPVEEATKEATPLEVPKSPDAEAHEKPEEKLIAKVPEALAPTPAPSKTRENTEKTVTIAPKLAVAPPKVVKKAAPSPAPAVQPKAVKAAADEGAETKIFRVQLGAFRSRDAASKQWRSLQKKHWTLLGKLPYNIQSVKITGRGQFFRLQAGKYASRDAAMTLCTKLKTEKQDCLIAGS